MSKREKIIYLSVGVAYLILFIGLIPAHYKICEINQYTEHEHCTAYQVLPFLFIKVQKILNSLGVAITALATIAIAAFTYYLKKSTDKLWDAGERQLTHLKDASERQAKDMESTIAAAQESNRLNRDAFITTQRPWIAARVEIAGPLEYDVNGLNVSAFFYLTNTGNSPAIHVNVYPQVAAPAIGVDNIFDVRGIIQNSITQRRNALLSPWGSTIHPAQTNTEKYKIVSISKDELTRITQKVKYIHPVLIVVIEYRFVFDAGVHFTAFALDIEQWSPQGRKSIAPSDGNIPPQELRFQKSFAGGEYAD